MIDNWMTFIVVISYILPINALADNIKYLFIIFIQFLLNYFFNFENKRSISVYDNNTRSIANKWKKYIIQNKILAQNEKWLNNKFEPSGIILGKYFLAFIHIIDKDYCDITVYATKNFWKNIDKDEYKPEKHKNEDKINNQLSIDNTFLHKKPLKYSSMYRGSPRKGWPQWTIENTTYDLILDKKDRRYETQLYVMKKIMEDYYKNKIKNCWPAGNSSIIVTGKSGIGKSTIPKIIAHEYNMVLCDEFCPILPGDWFRDIYKEISLSNKEMIIVINEFPSIVEKSYNGIKRNDKEESIQHIYDKDTLNGFLDMINNLPGIILYVSSNKKLDWYNKMDEKYFGNKSLLREGRFNLKIEI